VSKRVADAVLRKVAIKILRPELAAIRGAERFLGEVDVTANLQHPNILPLHDSGDADSFLDYVMRYVEAYRCGEGSVATGSSAWRIPSVAV